MKPILLFLLAAAAGAQDWKAGVARAVITPREPIRMAGYAARTKPSEGVRRDLYVKVLALEDRAGHTFFIVTADLIGWNAPLTAAIAERAGVPLDRLLLAASHSHSGPVTGQLGQPNYEFDEAESAVVRRYMAWLIDTTADAMVRARSTMTPARVSFAQGFAGFAVNRRRVNNRALPGPVDHDVPVLAVHSADGQTLRAVVAGYACHGTVLEDNLLSGDWPGYFQEAFEKDHPGAETLYVTGCGADANALPRRTVELARIYGQVLAAAVDQVLRAPMTVLAGPIESARETVDLPFAPFTRAQFEADKAGTNLARRRNAELKLALLDKGGKLRASYPYPITVWNFGGRLTWIELASEVVADYALRLKAQHGWNTTWVSAYANDYCGYIPSQRVLKEGGYEGGDAMLNMGHPGPWAATVEDIIVAKTRDLVARTSTKTGK